MASRFVDNTIGDAIRGVSTFTNGSNTVNGDAACRYTEDCAMNGYIKPDSKPEWYKIMVIVNDQQLRLSWNYVQANTAESASYNDKDGQTVGNAFCHLRQATTDEVRVAGDLIYIRRGQTHTHAGKDTEFDEDGDQDNLITLMGDDGTGWAGETGLAKPIIDFGGNNISVSINMEDFWKFEDIEVTNSGDRGFELSACNRIVFKDVDTHDHGNVGIYFSSVADFLIDGGSTYNANNQNIYLSNSRGKIRDHTLNSGANNTSYGIFMSHSYLEIEDSTLGATVEHVTSDLYIGYSEVVLMRNVNLASTTPIAWCPTLDATIGTVKSEDDGQVKAAHKTWFNYGTVTKDTGVVRSGGALSSAKVETNADCGVNRPISLTDDFLKGDFKVWCRPNPTTATVYIRAIAAYTVYPTATELYITAEYWDGVTAKRIESTHSAQVLSDATTWVAFTTTFTPSAEGWAYVKAYLKKHEANKGIYVDVKPIVA